MWEFLWAVASIYLASCTKAKQRDRVNIQALLPCSDSFLLENCSWNHHILARQLWKHFLAHWYHKWHKLSIEIEYCSGNCFLAFSRSQLSPVFLLSLPLYAELPLKRYPAFVYCVRAVLKKKCVSVILEHCKKNSLDKLRKQCTEHNG